MPKIEKNVPFPVATRTGKEDPLYKIFSKMEIGDSVLLDLRENNRSSIASAAEYKRKNKGTWDYTSRKIDGKIRIWRTAVKSLLKPEI